MLFGSEDSAATCFIVGVTDYGFWNGAVIISQLKGKTRVYQFNPRYVFLDELKQLLEKGLSVLPPKQIQQYYKQRTRPRRKGKK